MQLIDDDGNLRFVSSRVMYGEAEEKERRASDVDELIEQRMGMMQSGCKVSTCKPSRRTQENGWFPVQL
jgi:hypothetical protein